MGVRFTDNLKSNLLCFSYTKNDLIILLLLYDFTFYSSAYIFSSNLTMSLLASLLIMLVVLFIITVNDILDIKQLNRVEIRNRDNEIRKRISTEYQKAHLKSIKQNLILKTGLTVLNPESKEFEGEPKVHLSFLNEFDADIQASDSEGITGKHQGS